MAMNSEYRGSASNVAKKKVTTRKTVATPGTKVSQATIDKIKAMGMTKALKGAANASPEMREGLKRLYGAKRVAAAGGSSARYSSPDAARAGASKSTSSGGGKYVGSRFVPNTPPAKKPTASGVVYKSADAARAAATKTSGTRIGAKTVMAPKPNVKPKKSQETTDPFARAVFGAGGAIKRALTGGSNQGMTAAQVAAENKRRAAAVAKAKANKNK